MGNWIADGSGALMLQAKRLPKVSRAGMVATQELRVVHTYYECVTLLRLASNPIRSSEEVAQSKRGRGRFFHFSLRSIRIRTGACQHVLEDHKISPNTLYHRACRSSV